MTIVRLFSYIAIWAALSVPAGLSAFAQDQAASQTGEATAEAQPAELIPLTTPFAKCGGDQIDLGFFLYYAREDLRFIFQAEGEQIDKNMRDTLEKVFFERRLYQQAMDSGFEKDPVYISRNKLMESDYLSRLYTYHHFTQNWEPTEERLQAMYDEQKEKYHQPLQFSFKHIFFRTIDLPEDQQKSNEAESRKALALIRSGSSFEEVAESYSDSERKGDVIGPLKSRKDDPDKAINPVLEDALLAMKPGEVSDVIKTKYGFEILKLETLDPEHYKPIEAVKPDLKSEMRRTDFEQWQKDVVNEHWDEAVKDFNSDLLFDSNADKSAVIAEVYGVPITREDYLFAVRPPRKEENETDEAFHQRIIDEFKTGLLRQILTAEIARKEGYEQIPAYRMLTEIQRIHSVQQEWFNRKAKEYADANKPTEEEKKAFYDENKALFRLPQKIHLLVMEFDMPEHDKESKYDTYKAQTIAQNRAEAALKRVKVGEDFGAVAKEVSSHESAQNGGDVGMINNESSVVPPSVISTAMRLEDGKLCEEPIKSGDSYFIFQMLGKGEIEYRPYDDQATQDQLSRRLEQNAQQQFYKDLKAKLLDGDTVEILYKDYANLQPARVAPLDYDVPKN